MCKSSVFISYSSKDKEWVKDYLLANLEKNGIPCHIDFRDFEIGTASLINMEKAVEKCSKTILVFTPDWVKSDFTNFEGLMLQTDDPAGLKKRILPILLQECSLPKRLKIFTYANFTNKTEWDTQLDRVIKQIKKDLKIAESEKKTYPVLKSENIDIIRLPQTGFELFGRSKELTQLNEAWESGSTNVISFVAYGGVGKSTLVNKWTEKMRWDNYRGAEKIYAWSFYSQGTSERVTSADAFISHALEWFGDDDPTQGSAWDKGKRLAQLINEQKTLLILDGMEPLQSEDKILYGKIKDPALETLVKELSKFNKGLCIITTREHVPELDRYPNKTSQQDLEHISAEAGRKLLETRRITGTENELENIVKQFGNHALAINLLAEYLRLFENHPLEKASSIPDLNIPDERGRHARRVIEAFAQHLGNDSCECQLLSMLGLFDRPVPIDAIKAIISNKPIAGLCNKIESTKDGNWQLTLKNLRKHKLLFKESEHRPETLDCHPLIREHFGEKLEKGNPDAWKEAHARLYAYYKSLPQKLYGKELPDTLEEMEPLFAAVMHGCLAGKHQTALVDVFYNRIRRGNEGYDVHKLGAVGADLSCLSQFFERLWDKPAAGLTEGVKAVILSWAGFALRAVGRLSEAVQPMKAGLEMLANYEDWKNGAGTASNLSELYLTLGDVASAQKYGAQSVAFADRSGDDDWKFLSRTAHADALHQAGETGRAETLFIEAENMQKKRRPQYPYLYSLRGFQFCDLLLQQGKYPDVLKRARTTIKYEDMGYTLLDVALDKLTIGKSLMLQALTSPSVPLQRGIQAEDYLNQAVDGLRESGNQDDLPRGLFARATFYRRQKDFLKSWADLDEAREIAEYGGMKLYFVDYHLQACRNISEQLTVKSEPSETENYQIIENGETLSLNEAEMQARFQKHFEEAERLINKTGYHRRDGELAELRGNEA